MLINLRNALMTGKRLPYDAELEYLESTGTQWIDTGVLANGEFDVEYTIQMPPSADFQSRFMVGGARSASQHLNFGQYDASGWFTLGFLGNYWATQLFVAANALYTVKIHYAYGSQTATINGTNATSRTLTGTEALNLNIYLFKRNFYGASDDILPMKGRMYAFKIWQNGVLVRDFIPVRKGQVGYLYDRVSGKLFGNAGTGDFVLGPDVVPVEYIESHGTEYIDTGLVWDSLKWECVADITATKNINENYIISQYRSGQGAVYAFVYMHQDYARLAYKTNNADSYVVNNQFFGTKHTWHAIYESGAQRLDIGDNIHLSASQQYVAGLTEEGMRIIIGGMQTFGSNAKGVRFGNVIINHDSNPSRSFLPVRVGTEATSWEGAMMDVLTRRIYRNAGTGAFTYGNDLKYPIPAE